MSVQLGKDIAAARHKAKLSGKQLAERVGVSDGWVRQLETGRMKKPNPQKLAAVATELGLSVQSVLAMTDQLGADITEKRDEAGDIAAAIREQSQAIRENTDAVRQLLEALTARVMTPELAQAYQQLEPATLPTHPGRTPSPRPESHQETSMGRS